MQRSHRPYRRSQRGSIGSSSGGGGSSAQELAQALTSLEERLQRLRSEIDQLLHQEQLQEQIDRYSQSPTHHREEIQALQSQADAIEAEFVSRFLSWQHLREPFWQAVRFGGGGLVLGFLLRGCTGG